MGTISCQSGDQLDLYVQCLSGDNPDRVYVLSVVWNLAADPKMYTEGRGPGEPGQLDLKRCQVGEFFQKETGAYVKVTVTEVRGRREDGPGAT